MFTGLVHAVGRVVWSQPAATGRRLGIDPQGWAHHPAPGDSVSVSGCCLTVAAVESGSVLVFDVVPQTLRLTTLGSLAPGRLVNLEHAATPSTLLGGHIVQGHVDGLARVVEVVAAAAERRVRLQTDAALAPYLVPQGSVALDGVSLTLAAVEPGGGAATFEVALIPVTLARTTLGSLGPGDECNIEADCLAKTMIHYLRHFGAGSAGPTPPSRD